MNTRFKDLRPRSLLVTNLPLGVTVNELREVVEDACKGQENCKIVNVDQIEGLGCFIEYATSEGAIAALGIEMHQLIKKTFSTVYLF